MQTNPLSYGGTPLADFLYKSNVAQGIEHVSLSVATISTISWHLISESQQSLQETEPTQTDDKIETVYKSETSRAFSRSDEVIKFIETKLN